MSKKVKKSFQKIRYENSCGYQEHLIRMERPVLRIGANMQFEQKLIQQHIRNMGNVIHMNPTKFPIVYCIKDHNQVILGGPGMPRTEATPICLSIFPESFDPKK